MPSSLSLGALSRSRVLLLLGVALILAAQRSTDPMTAALFTAVATNAGNTISTATLNLAATPTGSTVFTATNMVPGDFYLNTVNIVNGATTANQSFTYNVAAAASPSSFLDSHTPGATTTSGLAFLVFRCTSDTLQTTPVACSTANVYVTQIYPAAGAGTQKQIAAGLSTSSVGAVATGGAYTIPVGGTSFTGGQVTFTAFNMGGPDSVTGADGQTKGLAGASPNHTDYLATLVYLPSQVSDPTMMGLTSTVTFTWTATQRAGRSLP